jgi:DNA-binding XRE family transcriptional regulator
MVGLTQRQIADLVEISPTTLTKHYAKELAYGDQANANVAKILYQKALNGDTTAAIFWLKARFGWRDRDAAQLINAPVTVSVEAKTIEQDLLNALEGRVNSKRKPELIEHQSNQ